MIVLCQDKGKLDKIAVFHYVTIMTSCSSFSEYVLQNKITIKYNNNITAVKNATNQNVYI